MKSHSGETPPTSRGNSLLLRRPVYFSDPLQEKITRIWGKIIAAVSERQRTHIRPHPFDKLHMNFIDYGEYLLNSSADPEADRDALKELLLPPKNTSLGAAAVKLSAPRPLKGQPAGIALELKSLRLDIDVFELRQRLLASNYLTDSLDEHLSSPRVVIGEIDKDAGLGVGRSLDALLGRLSIRQEAIELGPAEMLETHREYTNQATG